MKVFFGLILTFLTFFISMSVCDEREEAKTLTDQILENFNPQELKKALQEFIEKNNLDFDVSNCKACLRISI